MTPQEPLRVGDLTIRYLIDGAERGGLGVFELTVPPGAKVPPPHRHAHNEECLWMLEGTLAYAVEEDRRDLRPGEWMFTPKGAVHHFSNPHGETARALVILTPDIGADYFRDIAEVLGAGGPPDRARMGAVMARYGLTPVAPAGA